MRLSDPEVGIGSGEDKNREPHHHHAPEHNDQRGEVKGCSDGTVYVTVPVMEIVEYETEDGRSPFGRWFEDLDSIAAAKIVVALARLESGNISNVKSVGEGVLEQKIDFGPGYRIYFGRDGATIVVLLGGGTKRRQQNDIADAIERWRDYKARKRKA